MADADEDVMPRAGGGEDVDLSDETQDFRFLTSISKEDATIPKRGEKDFEPHATALQSNTLAASRQAMHNALSYQRVHAPKGYTIGTYHPETNMAYTTSPRGPLFAKMGHVRSAKNDPLGHGEDPQRGQRIWLLPEEVLYLLERGTIDIRWPALDGDEVGQGLPMSLQGAYAMFLGDSEFHNESLTFERYSVYSGLKRMGYTVLRAPSWNSAGPPPGMECYPMPARRTWQAGLLDALSFWKIFWFSKPADNTSNHHTGPLVQNSLHRDYNQIFQRLALINFHDPTAHFQTEDPSKAHPDFRITYHVWKPGSTTFKKSAPGIPDFRIAVINARETTPPTLEQMGALMDSTPYDPPKPDGHMHAKFKYGYKNVIFAIVDQGVTSYLRIADAAFGREKVYERRAPARGGKRGGGRGGRGGRGRGNGR
ncbi:related to tRNA-splicing endonuclease subunit [Ramularia collo-cygni]|uniref:Related to tRNA-splicing endonuclease subunit n=1 Tax=Ramularia collo-cygni TaxID=112498 RepID=A0A2D3UR42_9PEZI|nr:related to tRNA-splicing endonuclease subunit [Ramularia collo-cygni]CZT14820.1 related to tRNA-splicing endonuclease subunit [Ramularia collo-cygni]